MSRIGAVLRLCGWEFDQGTATMNLRNTASLLAATALLLTGCKNSGDDPLPPNPNPPVVNQPPVANAGADQQVPSGAAISLNGSGSDPDGTITFAWTQTSGTAVTLTGGATATPTFIAPSSAGVLQFRLTVTDNQGATSSDTVDVSVSTLAAPVIVRQPTHVIAYEYGMALMFVVAQGQDLTYDWRYSSGAAWSSGSEPYMVRGTDANGLSASDDGRCFYVVVSNAAGSVTSEEGCLTVVAIEGEADPSDDNPQDNWSMASSYGTAVMEVAQVAAGGATGGAPQSNRSAVPHLLGSGQGCSGGRYVGATLDGQGITQATALPLGRHTITEIWESCGNGDVDEPRRQDGGVMITYDFPVTFGVGTYTMYLSGFGEHPEFNLFGMMNGILHVTNTPTVGATGLTHDEIEITLEPDFCASALRLKSVVGADYITLDRRLNADNTVITDATLDWDLFWNDFDQNGLVGTSHKGPGSSDRVELHFDIDASDDEGESPYSSEGEVMVWMDRQFDSWFLGRILAGWGQRGWQFHTDESPPP
jgi:hypothetical protein